MAVEDGIQITNHVSQAQMCAVLLQWDPAGSLLASASEDGTVRIWSHKADESVLKLEGHQKDVYLAA